MLGLELARECVRRRLDYRLTDRSVDISNPAHVASFMVDVQPVAVFNAAAYTDVEGAETNVVRSYQSNVLGPVVLAEACRVRGKIDLCQFSTDYVYDGLETPITTGGYHETPLNHYGRSKLAGDNALLSGFDNVYVIRTSGLFGEHGRRNFVRSILYQLQEQHCTIPITVVGTQRFRPTYARDLAIAALDLMGFVPYATGNVRYKRSPPLPSGLYHFANRGDVSWFEFAEAIRDGCRGLGIPIGDRPLRKVESGDSKVKRPAWSVLDTQKFENALPDWKIRDWRPALVEYLRREFL